MNRKDPEEIRKYHAKRYAETRRGSFWKRLRDLLYNAKKRAKKLNIEFTITIKSFKEQTHCLIFKHVQFNFSSSKKNGSDSMSIDRIDPSKGYTPDNVWLISQRANRIKNDASPEELRLIAEAVAERMSSHAKGE